MVGSPSTYWLAGVIGLVLVSILTKVTLSPWALASSSMIGATCLHGPHQSAQKSTTTGLSDFSTTSEKVASVTSATAPIPCSLVMSRRVRDAFVCGGGSHAGFKGSPPCLFTAVC